MNKDKYVFAQIAEFLDHNKFRRLVDKYAGDSYVKHFTCWNQLLTLMFGQLSGRDSLRDLVTVIEAHRSKCYHLGLGSKPVSRNAFAVANQRRNSRIFEEFAFSMMAAAREICDVNSLGIDGRVFAFDSTTIPLCLAVFPWARFRRRKGGVKAHVLYDLETQVPSFYHVSTASIHDSRAMPTIPLEEGAYYVFDRGYNAFAELWRIDIAKSFFVVRAKKNLRFKCVKWRRRLPANILGDAEIVLTETASAEKFPGKLRLVRFHDTEQNRDFAFLTNSMTLSSLEVAELYKNRWQIELFFKWLKQHLRIRKFWGTSENAVRIQLAVAVITFCLVAIVRRKLQIKRSPYEMLQILEVSLTDRTYLIELFGQERRAVPDNNETPFLPGLFD